MIGVDCPRDIFLVSQQMRERAGCVPVSYSKTDLLNALYVGAGAIPTETFYAPMWCALEALIVQVEMAIGESAS